MSGIVASVGLTLAGRAGLIVIGGLVAVNRGEGRGFELPDKQGSGWSAGCTRLFCKRGKII
jgi:hypothetical protein